MFEPAAAKRVKETLKGMTTFVNMNYAVFEPEKSGTSEAKRRSKLLGVTQANDSTLHVDNAMESLHGSEQLLHPHISH